MWVIAYRVLKGLTHSARLVCRIWRKNLQIIYYENNKAGDCWFLFLQFGYVLVIEDVLGVAGAVGKHSGGDFIECYPAGAVNF